MPTESNEYQFVRIKTRPRIDITSIYDKRRTIVTSHETSSQQVLEARDIDDYGGLGCSVLERRLRQMIILLSLKVEHSPDE